MEMEEQDSGMAKSIWNRDDMKCAGYLGFRADQNN